LFFGFFALLPIKKRMEPIEFFMTTMVMDMQAPQYGEEKLEDFFNQEAKNK
jgi:hypothetical protein